MTPSMCNCANKEVKQSRIPAAQQKVSSNYSGQSSLSIRGAGVYSGITDGRPVAIVQAKLQEDINNSPPVAAQRRLAAVIQRTDDPAAMRDVLIDIGSELKTKLAALNGNRWGLNVSYQVRRDLSKCPKRDICTSLENPARYPRITHIAFSKGMGSDEAKQAVRDLKQYETLINQLTARKEAADQAWDDLWTEVDGEYQDYSDNGGNRGRNNGGEYKVENNEVCAYIRAKGRQGRVRIKGAYTIQETLSGAAFAFHRPCVGWATFIWHYHG